MRIPRLAPAVVLVALARAAGASSAAASGAGAGAGFGAGFGAEEPPPVAHERADRTVVDLDPQIVLSAHLYEGPIESAASAYCDPVSGEVYVADSGKSAIAIFDEAGSPVFTFTDDERWNEPAQVIADPRGRIYVIDNDTTRIRVYSYRGEYLSDLSLPGVGPKPSFTAMAFDARGNLYVGESRSGRVLGFDPDLRPFLSFGYPGIGKGEFTSICGIAVDDERIYVCDRDGVAVQVFTRAGRFVRGWGYHEIGVHNVSLPSGIAVDAKGRVILLDTLRQEIKYFDPEGRLIEIFGGLGRMPGDVMFPTSISIDRMGRLCVADRGNARVQILAPIEAEPAPESDEPLSARR